MKAFTLIELIFVIVIIGVLSAFAVPKFANLKDNAKISAELATASSVQTALETIHAQWVTNRCDFTWGAKKLNSATTLSDEGYPKELGSKLENILKNASDWECSLNGANGAVCKGPATHDTKGVKNCKANKPCKTKQWRYFDSNGSFELTES